MSGSSGKPKKKDRGSGVHFMVVVLTFEILCGSEGVILIWIAQSESTRLYLEEAVEGGR
jgi:hypothetical protein